MSEFSTGLAPDRKIKTIKEVNLEIEEWSVKLIVEEIYDDDPDPPANIPQTRVKSKYHFYRR